VHVVHEAMEVAPLAIGEWQTFVEQVHQHGLAAANPAPEVQPANRLDRGAARQELQHAALEETEIAGPLDEALTHVVEPGNGAQLGGIRNVAVPLDRLDVQRFQWLALQLCSSGKLRKCSSACGLASASLFFTGRP